MCALAQPEELLAQNRRLDRAVGYRANEPAGEFAAIHRKPVADDPLETKHLRDRIGKVVEAARYQHRARAHRCERGHQRGRTRRGGNPLGEAIMDCAFIEPSEQRDALPQGRLEIEFTLHGAFGDRGDLRLQPCVIGQLVDAFLSDHGRIHVRDEQARDRDFALPCQHVSRRIDRVDTRQHARARAAVEAQLEHLTREVRGEELHPFYRQHVSQCRETRFTFTRLCYQPRHEHFDFS